MKLKKRSVGRPKIINKRVRYNIALLSTTKNLGAKIAFNDNKSFSRYIEDLILADAKAKKGA